jgi:hypothetical protein
MQSGKGFEGANLSVTTVCKVSQTEGWEKRKISACCFMLVSRLAVKMEATYSSEA